MKIFAFYLLCSFITIAPALANNKRGNVDILPVIGLMLKSNMSASPSTSYYIPDTGVYLCYDNTTVLAECPSKGAPFYGQDAQFNPTQRQQSYLDNGDETVTDKVTGLMWQQSDDANTRTFEEAKNYCSACTDGGHSDWRLPDIHEIHLLVSYTHNRPAIAPVFNAQMSGYWSSTLGATYPSVIAMALDFQDGSIDEARYDAGVWNDELYVRCVRGTTPTHNFKTLGSEMVHDELTNLTWQRIDDGVKRYWEEALSYCNNLILGGHEDWRLPDVKELLSIVDYSYFNPTLPVLLETAKDQQYCTFTSSTTPVGTAGGGASSVSFYKGEMSSAKKDTYTHFVRCVRDEN